MCSDRLVVDKEVKSGIRSIHREAGDERLAPTNVKTKLIHLRFRTDANTAGAWIASRMHRDRQKCVRDRANLLAGTG